MSFFIPFEFHKDDRLDGMTIVKPIARGGNGDLYLVQDDANQFLAMKVIRKTDNTDERNGIEQCRAVFSHIPGLVPILNTGTFSDGRAYCVMPPADNLSQWPDYEPDTLAARIKRDGRIPPIEILNIASEISSTVQALHDTGLAHCDIKPENILFINGKPKLADYSLLSDMGEHPSGIVGNADSLKVNSDKAKAVGTIGFIPPEMIENPVFYNPRTSDLYAIGKIIYCAWSGMDVIFFPSVPKDIAISEIGTIRPLYMKACNINPSKRFQNADEIISAIEDARSRLEHNVSSHVRSNFRKHLPALLLVFLILMCIIGLVNIVFLLRFHSGKEKQEPGMVMTGLFYDSVISDDNGTNNGKQNSSLLDPLIITTNLDIEDANDGVNSLREALNYAQKHGSGATISFASDCDIRLSASLSVTQNVIIDAGENEITLFGPESEPMFEVTDSRLTLKNISLVSDYAGEGGGIMDAKAYGRMDLFSVKDGGNAKLLWNVSHGFDVNLNDGTHLHRMKVSPPVSGDGSHIRINAGTVLEDTTLAGCSGRRGGDYEVRGILKNASVTEYGDVYILDGGVCEYITVKCASFQPYMETVSTAGGFVVNRLGGTINGMKLEYGGVYGYGKGNLTGTISLGGATIAPVQEDNSIVGDETDIVFDLTERTGESTFSFNYMANLLIYYVPGNKSDTIIDNMNAFSGARSYAIHVRKDQSPGIYRLAAHAAGFSSPVSLTVGDTVCKDVLSIGKSFSMENKIYKLALGDTNEGEAFYNTTNVLTLTISKTQDNEPE